MSGDSARILRLELASVAGMIALGWVAHTVALVLHEPSASLAGGGYLLAALVAGVLGLLISPFIAATLWKTKLDRSLPFVFGLGALITAIWVSIVNDETGITAAIPAVVSVMLLCLAARRRYPDPDYIGTRVCPECGYNLSGCRDLGCPECGWDRPPTEHTSQQP